jgi:hypothetical protein
LKSNRDVGRHRTSHYENGRYLFTHPVEQVGRPVPHDPNCPMDLRVVEKKPAKTNK